MRLALITDTHYGIRNDNSNFLDNNKLFLDNVFFPYIDRENIGAVIHLGDLVDRRKYINFNTANRLRQDFLEPLSHKVPVHIIAGNHDTYYKNTNSVNALQELVAQSYPFHIYDQFPKEVEFDETTILLTPWICDENRKLSFDKIRSTPAMVLFGHLELSGFQMFKGSPESHGDNPSTFDRFDVVASGHYHHRSSSGNIHYLGSHAEFTWSDYNDPRGFHVFDTMDRSLTFIPNPYTMFEKVWYDDSKGEATFDETKLKNKIVKVIVTNKTNPYMFDVFINKIEKVGVIDMQIVEDHMNLNIEDDNDIVNEAESTLSIFKKHIEQINTPNIDKNKLECTIVDLYNEALVVDK